MLIYQNVAFVPGHAVSSIPIPIYILPWQLLALDQLKYLQIAVN